MTAFQWVTLPVFAVLFLVDAGRLLLRRPLFRADRLMRTLVWLLAGLAIWNPELTSQAAALAGVQRGTDLVLYLFVLAFLAVSFYFYSRSVRLERQMTELVRHIAISEARREG
jgi:hypothetical protein